MRTLGNGNERRLALLVLVVLLATLGLNFLSAYIRHVESGLGCSGWPACYAQLGVYVNLPSQEAIARRALAPDPLAKQAHRLIATTLVLLVLLVVKRSRQLARGSSVEARIPMLMATLLLVLAVIGPASYLKTLPVIAAANLLGGIALAALAWRLWLYLIATPRIAAPAPLRRLTRAGFVLLCLQLALGAWVSANYAGLACAELADCPRSTDATARVGTSAFAIYRRLDLDAAGRVIDTPPTRTIRFAHRLGAGTTGLVLLVVGILAVLHSPATRGAGCCVVAFVFAQPILGLLAIAGSLPLWVVMAHSSMATLLLLAVIRLDFLFGTGAGAAA